MSDLDPEVEERLTQIEGHIRALRGDKTDVEPWDFCIPNGSDLRHMREECGLDREEMGKILDYTPQYILKIETGDQAPGRQYIKSALLLFKKEWPR